MTAQARNLYTNLASLGLEWKVLSCHELPGGTLVWLSVTPPAQGLAPSAAARELVIGETGVVACLKVRNPCRSDVLLPSDLVVDGGKQARVVARSVIIPASSIVEVPVRCVEEGRWHARDSRTAQSFEVSESVSSDSREHLARLRQSSLRRRKCFDLDQSEVWTHVASTLDREDLTSETSSYAAVLAKRQRRMEHARALAVRAPAGANGVAVIRRRGASWVEAFPSQDHVDAAVPSFVADLLEGPPAPVVVTGSGSSPSRVLSLAPRDYVFAPIEMAWAAEVIAVDTPPGTGGTSFALDADTVAGFVLLRGARLVHLAVSVGF